MRICCIFVSVFQNVNITDSSLKSSQKEDYFIHIRFVMDRLKLKRKIWQACFDQQMQVIENLRQVMEEASEGAEDYGLPKDMYDSYRSQLMSKRDLFAQQLRKVNDQVDILRRIDLLKPCPTVRFGAVVITESQKLFISAGIGKVKVNGDEYYALSALVPFYAAIDNKKPGDEYDFRGKKEKILEVF